MIGNAPATSTAFESANRGILGFLQLPLSFSSKPFDSHSQSLEDVLLILIFLVMVVLILIIVSAKYHEISVLLIVAQLSSSVQPTDVRAVGT